ncbi:MAG: SAM-dependent methyltransferase [Candidatus Moeniiplasma glomeromycotorum]|nr:SAM-dependent methyltransferase [Candidatus Moeniiplasma glomeromycotorum]MCE8168171.1 SAM-dependent methyltransferase [Candidatus Moeniiplasma glomeromycotorum]
MTIGGSEVQQITNKIIINLRYVNGRKMLINEKNIFDQYFTKRYIAEKLFEKVKNIISQYEKIEKYTWLEPSVGEGCFYDLLPINKKIGIDIYPKRKDVIKSDYLKYKLPDKPLIIIGNPPFGHRGVIALEFINHSKKADFVCFILPMFFDSKGKGSIKYRVKGFNLIYSEQLEENAFYTPNNNEDIDIKCVFQIWSKKHLNPNLQDFNWYSLRNKNPFKKYLDVFTVSLAKNRECGKKWIFEEKPDYYLSTTFYGENKVVNSFKKVKYKSGIAIKINTANKFEIQKIKYLLENTDWNKYSSLATNSCRHIGKVHVYELLKDNGFEIEL